MDQYNLLKQVLTLMVNKLPYHIDLSGVFDAIDAIEQRETTYIQIAELSKSLAEILQKQIDNLNHENAELKRIISKYDEKMEAMKKLIDVYNLNRFRI